VFETFHHAFRASKEKDTEIH